MEAAAAPGGSTSTRCVRHSGRREGSLDALAAWAQTPVRFTALKSEALLRLLVADLVGKRPRASMLTLRDDVTDLLARLDEIEAAAEALPHRRKYLLLVSGFMRRLFELHLDLVDRVERELDDVAD